MSSPDSIAGIEPSATADRTATAWALLDAACARAGLDCRQAHLVRLVGNALFRLSRHPVVVKIVLTPGLAHRADNAVAAANLLARHGIPVIRPLPGVGSPMRVDGYPVTFWRYVPEVGPAPGIDDLGRLLARLHRLPPHGLRAWNPIGDLRARIADAHGVDQDDLRFLRDRCDAVEEALAGVGYELPRCVIHGDARPGNLIGGPAGPVLCDLDTTGIGPAEWDLVPVAVAATRFRTDTDDERNNHHRLARAYGFDVARWSGFPVLREIRDLKLVCATLPAAAEPALAAESRRRLRSYRAGRPTGWARYR